MEREFKQIAFTDFEVKFEGDVAHIEGYASTFGNTDHQNDIVLPGAFKDSITRRLPKMLYQHKHDRIPGVWERAAEDTKGLILVGKTLNTTLGRDVAEEVRSGAIDTLSIGFGTKKARYDKAKGIRYLEQVNLHETSLVTFPANELAAITLVKGRAMSLREFEDFLREEGKFSHKDATTIALHGFKALPTQGEPDQEVLTTITQMFNQFR